MAKPFVISPHDVCDSCKGHSGPKFSLHHLEGISFAHRSNIIPKGSDFQSRLDGIRNAQSDIARLDIEITRLKDTLKCLEQRRAELQDFNHRELSLFSPIRTLPDDVIRKIFTTCQQDNEVKPGFIQFSNPNTFVRAATQVSYYWRNTALSMPYLWSRVSFKKYSKGHKRMSMSAGEFLEKCLTLSGSVPFSIEFGSPYGPASHRNFSEQCLKELAKAAGRWEHLTANEGYGGGVQLDTIMKYVPEDTVFSCLRTLAPVDSSKPMTLFSTPALIHLATNWPSNSTIISLPSAPSLISLDTRGSPGLPQNILPIFPWSQITHYRCWESFDSGQLPTLLDSMPNLIFLTMNLDRDIKLLSYMTLPMLEVLTFDFTGTHSSTHLKPFIFFITPRLKELHVNGDCESNNQMIVDLITRSGCAIETLSVSDDTLLQGEWADDQMKSVSHLNVRCGSRLSKATMEFLTWDGSSNSSKIIFPQVEILDIEITGDFCDEFLFPTEEFKAIVISRLRLKTSPVKTISYLKSMTVTVGRRLDKTQEDIITDFHTSEIIFQANVNVSVIVGD